jgi:putative DNA primase/helicase
MKHDAALIARELDGRASEVAVALLGKPTQRARQEFRWGNRGSLSLEIAGAKRGIWCDHEGGGGGDMLALVRRQHGGDMAAALHWARRFLGMPQGRTGKPPHAPNMPAAPEGAPAGNSTAASPGRELEASWSLDMARQLWSERQATGHEAYLAHRGFRPEPGAPLAFHPRAWRNSECGPAGPAMLALMTDPATAQPVGVHVTYLAPDGRGKAAGNSPKVFLGGVGVVRLVPDAEVTMGLGLAEGIETSLSVMQRAGWRPVWTATSAGGIARFPVLPGIEALTIFADADDRGAGIEAADKCARRWRDDDREATIIAAPSHTDWDDALRAAP